MVIVKTFCGGENLQSGWCGAQFNNLIHFKSFALKGKVAVHGFAAADKAVVCLLAVLEAAMYRIAKLVDTTVGYLLGETEETNVLKDPTMLKRLNEISTLPDDDRHCIIYAIDGLLQNVRTKQAFG